MVRQHVNPLSRFFQLERSLPPPAELFANPAQPIQLDIGCARGRFLLALAQQQPGTNHLGVEIRRPLVDAAEADRIFTILMGDKVAPRREFIETHSAELDFAQLDI